MSGAACRSASNEGGWQDEGEVHPEALVTCAPDGMHNLLKELPAHPPAQPLMPGARHGALQGQLPRKTRTAEQGDGTEVPQPTTKQQNTFSMDVLRGVFHMLREHAATALGVGLSSLKRCCNALGVVRWPHRKLQSLSALMQHHHANPLPHPEQQELMKLIQSEYNAILLDPNREVHAALQAKRVVKYKKAYSRKISAINREKRLCQQQAAEGQSESRSGEADGELEDHSPEEHSTDAASRKVEITEEQVPCKRNHSCTAADSRRKQRHQAAAEDKPVAATPAAAAAITAAAADEPAAATYAAAAITAAVAQWPAVGAAAPGLQESASAHGPVPLQAVGLNALPNIAALQSLQACKLPLPSLTAQLPSLPIELTSQMSCTAGGSTVTPQLLHYCRVGDITVGPAGQPASQIAQANALQALVNLSSMLDPSLATSSPTHSAWVQGDHAWVTGAMKGSMDDVASVGGGSCFSGASHAAASAPTHSPVSDAAQPVPAAAVSTVLLQQQTIAELARPKATNKSPVPASPTTDTAAAANMAAKGVTAGPQSQLPAAVKAGEPQDAAIAVAPAATQPDGHRWPCSPRALPTASSDVPWLDQAEAAAVPRRGTQSACIAGSWTRPPALVLPGNPQHSAHTACHQGPAGSNDQHSPAHCNSSPQGPLKCAVASPQQPVRQQPSGTATNPFVGSDLQWLRSCGTSVPTFPHTAPACPLPNLVAPSRTGDAHVQRPRGKFSAAVCTQLRPGVYRLGPAVHPLAEVKNEAQPCPNCSAEHQPSTHLTASTAVDDALAGVLEDAFMTFEAEECAFDKGCALSPAQDGVSWDMDLFDDSLVGSPPL